MKQLKRSLCLIVGLNFMVISGFGQAIEINSNNKVGINGPSSYKGLLNIRNGSRTMGKTGNFDGSALYITEDNGNLGIDGNSIYADHNMVLGTASNSNGYIKFITNGSEKMRINQSGKVAIGCSIFKEELNVDDEMYFPNRGSIWFNENDDNGNRLRFHYNSSYGGFIDYEPYLFFRSASNYSLHLANGKVGIRMGFSNHPSYALDVNGDIRCDNLHTDNADIRQKKEIKGLSNVSKKFKNIRAVSFKRASYEIPVNKQSYESKSKNNFSYDSTNAFSSTDTLKHNDTVDIAKEKVVIKPSDNKRHIGFIAQEFEKEFPELVSEDDYGYKSINYIELIPVLVEAIKEQQVEIEKKDQDMKKLIRRINKLERAIKKFGSKTELTRN